VHHCLPGADTVRLEVNTTADSRWVLSRGVLCEPFNYFHIVVLCLITLDSPVVGVYCVSLGVLAILYRSGILGGRAKLRKGTPVVILSTTGALSQHFSHKCSAHGRFALVKLCRSPRQCRPWVCSVWGLPYTPRFLLWQFRPRACWWHRAVATQVEIGAEIVKIICRPSVSICQEVDAPWPSRLLPIRPPFMFSRVVVYVVGACMSRTLHRAHLQTSRPQQ
jgi:hypothetical protein